MAIRVLRPTQGTVSIVTPNSYESVISKYGEELRNAILAEENAEIEARILALNNGDISFKEFKTYLTGVMDKYDENSQRRVDLISAMEGAQVNDLRNRDLLFQNKLKDRMISGGLTDSELLSIAQQRVDFLRKENTAVIDPETWANALDDLARVENNIRGKGNTELINRLNDELADLAVRYKYPNLPDSIGGAEFESRALDIYAQLEELGGMTASDYNIAAQLVQYNALRKQGQAFDLLELEGDFNVRYQASGSALANRYVVVSQPDETYGTSYVVWDQVTDKAKSEAFQDPEVAQDFANRLYRETPNKVLDASGEQVEFFVDPSSGKFFDRDQNEVRFDTSGIYTPTGTKLTIPEPPAPEPVGLEKTKAQVGELVRGVGKVAEEAGGPLIAAGTTLPAVATLGPSVDLRAAGQAAGQLLQRVPGALSTLAASPTAQVAKETGRMAIQALPGGGAALTGLGRAQQFAGQTVGNLRELAPSAGAGVSSAIAAARTGAMGLAATPVGGATLAGLIGTGTGIGYGRLLDIYTQPTEAGRRYGQLTPGTQPTGIRGAIERFLPFGKGVARLRGLTERAFAGTLFR